MSPRLARLLTRFYPPAWRERYGAEFEAFLESSSSDLRMAANVLWSALVERVHPTRGLSRRHDARSLPLLKRCVSTPWAAFGFAPLFLLAGAYLLACSILWSGWRFFLPGANTPFVRVDGWAVFYFDVGRLLYYGAPILIGWGVGLLAARQGAKAVWPTVGFVLVALLGGTAQVHARRPVTPGGVGRISMNFALASAFRADSHSLWHALVILLLTVLPYLVWRWQKAHFRST